MNKKPLHTELLDLFKKIEYSLPLILTAVFAYGFSFSNLSISTDDIALDRYATWDSQLFVQERFTAVLYNRFFRMLRNVPHFGDMLCVLLFIVAAMIFSVVLMRAAGGKLKTSSLTVFSCVLISYSLINEIYVYNGGNINVTLGFFITALALYFTQKFFDEKKKTDLVWSLLLLISVVSLYESFVIVYILGAITLLILEFDYNENDDTKKFSKALIKGLIMLIPVAAAVIIEFAIGKGYTAIFGDPEAINYGANQLLWFDDEYTTEQLLTAFKNNFILRFLVAPLRYLPVRTLIIAVFGAIIYGIVRSVQTKKFTIFALCGASVISLLVLSIISGSLSSARTCQFCYYFVAFFVMLLYQRLLEGSDKLSKKNKNTASKAVTALTCFFAFYLVFVQSYDLNAWICLDYQRYDEEKRVMCDVANELIENYDIENKPVIFVGNYDFSDTIKNECTFYTGDKDVERLADVYEKLGFTELSKNIRTLCGREEYKYVATNLNSYIGWASAAFNEANTELFKFLNYLGYDQFKQADVFSFRAANSYVYILPSWPEEGSIYDDGTFIIVKMGKSIVEEKQKALLGEN